MQGVSAAREEPNQSPAQADAQAQLAKRPLYIAGIGASAGGLEALERLFRSMPTNTGIAFVVVQHLSPDFKSVMDELLARHTRMPIHRVEDGMAVEANSVYLIPPKKEMIISGGRLLLTDKDPQRDLSLPIDHFFRSLAHDAGRCSIAIVLSGTGSDGSRGVRDIHEAGGLVVTQSEETAKFDGMPRSARDTGVVDCAVTPEQIPDVLIQHVNQPPSRFCGEVIEPLDESVKGISAIFRLLRNEYGIDFSHYKPNTVARRIERRISMNNSIDIDEYVDRLKSDPGELNSLYRDLLIGVTRFFRDRDAFERLQTDILPALIANKRADEEIRFWVAGTATGEEPYSLAILLHEQLKLLGRKSSVKIFATDVHGASLETASAGVYPAEALAEVTPQRLAAYFTKKGDGYQISSEIRQMIVFARHNVIKDAPFTKLDLISCRNLLIYFQPGAQKKALSLFHFGLRTGGILFLGPSESPGELSSEFETADEHWKIYRKSRDIRLPPDLRLPLSSAAPPIRIITSEASQGGFDAGLLSAYDKLLNEYMPPGLLITEKRQLVHAFGGAGQFLELRDGRATADLLELVHNDLKLALAGSLQRAAKDQTPVTYNGIRLRTPGADDLYKLSVKPILNRHSNLTHFFISIEKTGQSPALQRDAHEIDADEASKEQMNSLEAELRHTRENLQATIEELETSNEELQASNEELVASNEELQSTNEELHSVNEELYTVNAEYQKKITELTEMTDDMDNLLRSTDIGTIFLDKELCIRKFTPQIGKVFDLLPQDVGRRIDTFSHNIAHPGLHDDVLSVLNSASPIEKEVRDRHGHWYFLRILPYRSHSRLDGVVLSLIDISLLKRAEARLKQISAIVENSEDAIVGMDLGGRITSWNKGAEKLFGYGSAEAIGKSIAILRPDGDASQGMVDWPPEVMERMRAGQSADFHLERVRRRKDGSLVDVSMSISPIRDGDGQLVGVSKIARDVTERKQALEALAQRARLAALRAQIGSALTRDDELGIVLQRCAQSLVHHLDVAFARIWTLNEEQNVLELRASAGLYTHLNGAHGRIPLGQFKIGRIAENRLPLLTNDVQNDVEISDPDWARREGMVGFAGYPLIVSDRVVGVLGVFSRRAIPTSVQNDLHSICHEVAQFIQRKHSDEARRLAEEDAREGVRRRDKFLAMLSHELRNPLAAVVNASNLLQAPNLEPDSLELARGAIGRQSQHMARLLDDLLDVSRITRDKFEIRKKTLDLRQTTRDALEAVNPLLEGRNLRLNVTIAETPLWVEGDQARLQQIQANLLNNAIKYTPGGGQIWLSVQAEDNQVVISVRDTGPGIPEHLREKIFDIFVQLDRDNLGSDGGMGVGLTLVRALVSLHGGTVSVHTPGTGRGSEFVVRLPMVAPKKPAAAPTSQLELAGLRVLLVEDNADLREMTRRLLSSFGCDVSLAEDGARGIQAAELEKPQVALVDIGMPDMDGYEVARQIRTKPVGKEIKLIAVTGFGQPEDRQRAIDAGFDAHLVKPVNLNELSRLLCRLTDRPC